MRRLLIRVVAFLLLGAIVNVAVACAAIGRIRGDARWVFGTYLTIEYRCFGPPDAVQTEFECGFPATIVRGTTPPGHWTLPTWHVEWLGWPINTVFCAVVLWLLFAGPFVLRRWRRIRRGLCPKCAFDLRGSDSWRCPECGDMPDARSI